MPRSNLHLLVAVGLLSLVCYGRARSVNRVEYGRMQKTFGDVMYYIEHYYIRPVDRRQVFEAALEGMTRPLDEYSNYIPPAKHSFFRETLNQQFGGVGIQVTRDEQTGHLEVVTPLVGTPAHEAGLMPGDIILRIDEHDAVGVSLEQAVLWMRGPPGQPVRLRLRRPAQQREFEVTIVRQIIHVPTVLGDRYNEDGSWNFTLEADPRIGYIRILSFSQHTVEELRRALDACIEAGVQGIVLDLRYNPGGLLQAAIEISDLFLSEGVIVSTRYRRQQEQVYRARPEAYPSLPLAVLVNGYSASASEIVAACLQDHHRAIIVGQRTFGKGSVQELFELEDQRSALKLTVGTYHRPSGKNIHRFPDMGPEDTWGVLPDTGYEVPLEGEELDRALRWRRQRDVFPPQKQDDPKYLDPQLRRAVEAVRRQWQLAPPDAEKSSVPRPPAEKAAEETNR